MIILASAVIAAFLSVCVYNHVRRYVFKWKPDLIMFALLTTLYLILIIAIGVLWAI